MIITATVLSAAEKVGHIFWPKFSEGIFYFFSTLREVYNFVGPPPHPHCCNLKI